MKINLKNEIKFIIIIFLLGWGLTALYTFINKTVELTIKQQQEYYNKLYDAFLYDCYKE